MAGLLGFLFSTAIVYSAPAFDLFEGKPGVVRVQKIEKGELVLKTTSFAEPIVAARAAEISLGLIRGLYEPKKNPYAGEVTTLVKCDIKFAPIEFWVDCPGQGKTKAISGGVGKRRAFGICSEKDILEVGGFFSCYNRNMKRAVEVRMFIPYSANRSWAAHGKEIEMLAQELLH